MKESQISDFFAAGVQAWIYHASLAWGVPMGVVVLRRSRSRQLSRYAILPPASFLVGEQATACGRDGAVRKCFSAAVEQASSAPSLKRVVLSRCDKGCCVLALPRTLPGNLKCCFLCGCLPKECEYVEPQKRIGTLAAISGARSPIHHCTTRKERIAAVTAICSFWEEIEGFARTAFESSQLSHRALVTKSRYDGALRLIKRMMMYPEDAGALQHAFCNVGKATAVCHLEPVCDHRGECALVPRFMATRSLKGGEDSPLRPIKLKTTRVGFVGALRQGWRPVGEAQDCFGEWHRLQDLLQSKIDAQWVKRVVPLDKRPSKDPYVAVSYFSKRIPHHSCDLNPGCEARKQCPLLCEPEQAHARWWNRLIAVDVVLTTGSIFGDQVPLSLLQAAAMVAERQRDHGVVEDLALGGLRALSPPDQEAFLRYLFDQCRTIEEAHLKGAAFERFTDGLLQLIPGWVPERLNVTDLDVSMEFDLSIFIDRSVPNAEYWYDQFGPKILIECKNYCSPQGLPLKIKGESPVAKLHRKLRRTRVRLGLLLNTGSVGKALIREAERTARTNYLVVLLDGADIEELIKNPAYVGDFMKHRVSDAVAGLEPPRGVKRLYVRWPRRRNS